jgi:capsular polysaccharide biosynthesis protein
MGDSNDEVTIDLGEVMFHLLARWKIILCLALAFAILAGLITVFLITPEYRATSTIYVLSRKEDTVKMSDLQMGSALTNDYIHIFDLWAVHDQVKKNLNLPYDYKEMRKMLKVTNVDDTRMLNISITSPYPEEAANMANEYAEVASQYIADTMATDKPNVMSLALVPIEPVSPNKTKNIVLGLILGFVLAVGIVVVQTVVDDKYKTADDIRKYTGLNTLAVIPIDNDISTAKAIKRARKQV